MDVAIQTNTDTMELCLNGRYFRIDVRPSGLRVQFGDKDEKGEFVPAGQIIENGWKDEG